MALESQEFLSECLKAALEDPELVDAIAEQCALHGLSAWSIAQGAVTVEQLKDQLYLTTDEAKSVLTICTSMVTASSQGATPTTAPAAPAVATEPVALSSTTSATSDFGRLGTRISIHEEPAPTAVAEAPALPPPEQPLPVAVAEQPLSVATVYAPMPLAAKKEPLPVALLVSSTPSGRLATRLSIHEESAVPDVPEPVQELVEPAETVPEAFPESHMEASEQDRSASVEVPEVVVQAVDNELAVQLDEQDAQPEPQPQPQPELEAHIVPEQELEQEQLPVPEPEEEPAQKPMPAIEPAEPAAGVVVVSRTGSVGDAVKKVALASQAAEEPAAASPAPVRRIPGPPSTPVSAPAKLVTSPITRPASAPASAKRPSKISTLRLSAEFSAPNVGSPAESAPSVPSYLRPTAAHKARTSKDVDASPGGLAPVPEDGTTEGQQQRRKNLFARMTSTLLAPTQAFAARLSSLEEHKQHKKDASVMRTSLQLSTVLSSPQGQRVTKPAPFALRSEMRPKSCLLSRDEMDLIEAREKAFKRNPMPKKIYESKPAAPIVKSTPKDPKEIFEPFKLISLERHEKRAEELRKKAEADTAAEQEARNFKARSFDTRMAAGPISTPPKPAVSPVTKGSAPTFACDARLEHYKTVVEPAKRAKEEVEQKEKLEAEKRAKEIEALSIDEFRKTLEFKARPLPDFSHPFRPDPSLAKPVTEGHEPELHTVARLGQASSPRSRQDKEGPGLGVGVYDCAAYSDPFLASLRRSVSVSPSPNANRVTSLRRSAVVRQSAPVSRRLGVPASGSSASGSINSTLQAAIRAAARDAARDLAAAEQGTPTKAGCGAAGGMQQGSPVVACM